MIKKTKEKEIIVNTDNLNSCIKVANKQWRAFEIWDNIHRKQLKIQRDMLIGKGKQ